VVKGGSVLDFLNFHLLQLGQDSLPLLVLVLVDLDLVDLVDLGLVALFS